MSPGIRSGVNWMRPNSSDRPRAKDCASSVLAVPGTPSSSTWPSQNRSDQHQVDRLVLADDRLGDLLHQARPRRPEPSHPQSISCLQRWTAASARPAAGGAWGAPSPRRRRRGSCAPSRRATRSSSQAPAVSSRPRGRQPRHQVGDLRLELARQTSRWCPRPPRRSSAAVLSTSTPLPGCRTRGAAPARRSARPGPDEERDGQRQRHDERAGSVRSRFGRSSAHAASRRARPRRRRAAAPRSRRPRRSHCRRRRGRGSRAGRDRTAPTAAVPVASPIRTPPCR